MPNYLFSSARLGFRNWQERDQMPFSRMNTDPKVMEHFPGLLSKEESDGLISRFMDHQEQYGFCFFAVDETESGNFIGFIGLKRTGFEEFFTPCVEIGWRLHPDFWGKGYATEGAVACLDFGFNQLNLDKIVSFTTTTNHRSEKVMQRIGMSKVAEFELKLIPEGHPLRRHVLYEINSKPHLV